MNSVEQAAALADIVEKIKDLEASYKAFLNLKLINS